MVVGAGRLGGYTVVGRVAFRGVFNGGLGGVGFNSVAVLCRRRVGGRAKDLGLFGVVRPMVGGGMLEASALGASVAL